MLVTVLIVVTVLAFGPVLVFIYAFIGTTLSALLTFGIRYLLGYEAVHRLLSPRLKAIDQPSSRPKRPADHDCHTDRTNRAVLYHQHGGRGLVCSSSGGVSAMYLKFFETDAELTMTAVPRPTGTGTSGGPPFEYRPWPRC
ncbi:MAG: hypothetical protein ACREYF_24515 [Gammaproteobacteria bacterium]